MELILMLLIRINCCCQFLAFVQFLMWIVVYHHNIQKIVTSWEGSVRMFNLILGLFTHIWQETRFSWPHAPPSNSLCLINGAIQRTFLLSSDGPQERKVACNPHSIISLNCTDIILIWMFNLFLGLFTHIWHETRFSWPHARRASFQ